MRRRSPRNQNDIMKFAQTKTFFSLGTLAAKVTVPALALLLTATTSQARGDEDDSDVNLPSSLEVPAGNVLQSAAHARGVQIYSWSAAAAKWVFVAPSAVLFEEDAGVVAIHYAGPTWQSTDGSKVVGTKVAAAAVNPNAIPWLLLKGTASGPGVFSDITYIQRVETRGGLAPATAGTFDGQQVLVPYSAMYLFYRAE